MGTFTGHEWQALAEHVAPYRIDPEAPDPYVSTFNAAVREARYVCGRDVDTGQRLDGRPVAIWAGTLVYLVLLEQIGNTLRPVSGRDLPKQVRESAAARALRQFAPHTTKPQREVIYALRNAFAHEFGLFNDGRDGRYRHVFTLDDEPGGPLVRWPRRRWDGTVEGVRRATRTTVNLVAVGDLCEDVVRSVREHSNSVALRSRVPMAEMQKRFAFRISETPG
jgi:hypothetical protein